MLTWFRDVWEGFFTVLVGMNITWRHLFVKKVTLHYPEEKWSLPPRSRMRLFMKYEDCIGCGQCARACPVDCIYIKTEKRDAKAPPIWAADGTPIKLDTRVFDIDMSLCCYCNLCTYPCPTNCIYMTTEYEFAATDITQHLYHFAKPNAKFLTVNPKAAAKPAVAAAGAPNPAAAAAAAAAAPKPVSPAAVPGGAAAAAPAKPSLPGAAVTPPATSPAASQTAATAPAGAPKPEAPPPSPGDVPKQSVPVGVPENPAPNVATGTPPSGVKPAGPSAQGQTEGPKDDGPKPDDAKPEPR